MSQQNRTTGIETGADGQDKQEHGKDKIRKYIHKTNRDEATGTKRRQEQTKHKTKTKTGSNEAETQD